MSLALQLVRPNWMFSFVSKVQRTRRQKMITMCCYSFTEYFFFYLWHWQKRYNTFIPSISRKTALKYIWKLSKVSSRICQFWLRSLSRRRKISEGLDCIYRYIVVKVRSLSPFFIGKIAIVKLVNFALCKSFSLICTRWIWKPTRDFKILIKVTEKGTFYNLISKGLLFVLCWISVSALKEAVKLIF